MTIKLLVACRKEESARELCARLLQSTEAEIAVEAISMAGALRRAAATQPDVLLLEHTQADPESSLQVLSRAAQVSADTRVLLLCDSYTHRSIVTFIQLGASGCVLAASEHALQAKAVVTVHEGQTWFGRTDLLQALRSQMDANPLVASDVLDEHELLTAREREILTLIGAAMSNKEIARQLNISDHTVKTHLHHIYVKLEKSGRYKAFLSNAVGASGSAHAAFPGA